MKSGKETMEISDKIKIVEKSFLARVARAVRKSDNIAMVLGGKIYLSGVSKKDFLNHPKWVKHELIHVEQFRKYGLYRFVWLYLWEWLKNGYRKNRFEIEAREGAEKP